MKAPLTERRPAPPDTPTWSRALAVAQHQRTAAFPDYGGQITYLTNECEQWPIQPGYKGELHTRDWGVHVHQLEEWRPGPWWWGGAHVCVNPPTVAGKARRTRVIVVHPFVAGDMAGAVTAMYGEGEGNLLTLSVRLVTATA